MKLVSISAALCALYALVCFFCNSASWRPAEDVVTRAAQEHVGVGSTRAGSQYLDLVVEASTMPDKDASLAYYYLGKVNAVLQEPEWEFPSERKALFLPDGAYTSVWSQPMWLKPLLGVDKLSEEFLYLAKCYMEAGQSKAASDIVLNNLALSSRLFVSKRYLLALGGAIVLDQTVSFIGQYPDLVRNPDLLRAVAAMGGVVNYSVLNTSDYYVVRYQVLRAKSLAPLPCFANRNLWEKEPSDPLSYQNDKIVVSVSPMVGYSDFLCYAVGSAPKPEGFGSLQSWLKHGEDLHRWMTSVKDYMERQDRVQTVSNGEG